MFEHETFVQFIDSHPEIFPIIVLAHSKTVEFLLFDCANQCFSSGLIRCFNYLYSRCFDDPNHFCPILNITQVQIMKSVGLNKTNTIKVLNRLKQEQIIETKRNQIHILDLEKLMKNCSPEIILSYFTQKQ